MAAVNKVSVAVVVLVDDIRRVEVGRTEPGPTPVHRRETADVALVEDSVQPGVVRKKSANTQIIL